MNAYDIAADYGPAPYSRKHRFVSTFVYELPFGRGQRFGNSLGRTGDLLIGGWRLTGVTLVQSGPFLTPTFTGPDPSGTNPSQRSEGAFQRPDCTGINPNSGNQSIYGYWNNAAFSVPGNDIGRFGTCGVGILNGPGTKTFSASLGKDFRIGERFAVRYEAQFANLFNVTNYAAPNTQFSSGGGVVNPSFGVISATQTGEQAAPRTIQMLVRFLF